MALPGRPTWSSTQLRRGPRRDRRHPAVACPPGHFADAVHLRNDLYSYQREVEDEGENANIVLVLERFLGAHDLQPVHERTARASCTPTPLLRGPRGLGTSAARLDPLSARFGAGRLKSYRHVPFQGSGTFEMPELYMPFTYRMNPHLEAGRRQTKEWAVSMGFADEPENLGLWNVDKVDDEDYSSCAAMSHPDGSLEEFELTSNWFVWATFFDDYFPARFFNTRDFFGGKAFMDRLSQFMTLDPSDPVPVVTNPIERGMADLWPRTLAVMSEAKVPRYRDAVQDMFDSWVWELVNHVQYRIPDPVDYMEMRRHTFGSGLGQILSEPQSADIPDEIFRTRPIRALANSASDATMLLNDIVSYRKEIELEAS